MSDEKDDPGFVVIDRRGQESEPEVDEPPEAPAAAGDLPKPDFGTFLLSLGTSALYHMGLVADPETGEPAPPNLPVARQTIDTIEVLQEKTRGNLDENEERLLQSLLTELRMRYVEATR